MATISKDSYYLGVDVGTGSVRSAIISPGGDILSLAVVPITIWNPRHSISQQSSTNIWSSICSSVRTALSQSNLLPSDIKGVGFDATCSLVVLDKDGEPLSVDQASEFEEHEQNIILWADHRAQEQAERINSTGSKTLKYVGGKISLEMEIPKILWLKENMPSHKWDRIGHLFDLPDFLTFRATGELARSACSLICKCSSEPLSQETGMNWDHAFFEEIGLGEFIEEKFKRIVGNGQILFAGDPVGKGLTKKSAEELGLLENTPVGSAIIDAYAGAIATLGASLPPEMQELKKAHRLAIICGTSSCHIAMSPEPIFVPGVWGPYQSVIVPNMWCSEGGQSSTGQLIDYILTTHPSSHIAQNLASESNTNIYTILNKHLARHQGGDGHIYELTRHFHIYPDFHGNRSPASDPSLRGVTVGQSLDTSLNDLALRYLAAMQAIACQTRHIIEELNARGYAIDTLCLSGGLCKNEVFVRLHADITRCRVILPGSLEGAVVIGAAFLGARAATRIGVWEVMTKMGKAGDWIEPIEDQKIVNLCERKYKVFRMMLEDQRKYQEMMSG